MNKEQLNEYTLKTLSEQEAQALVEKMRADIISKEITKRASFRLNAERLARAAQKLIYPESQRS